MLESGIISRRELTLNAINILGLRTKPANIGQNTKQVMLHCPIHGKDRTPSFGLDLENGRGHCFACGWSGSIETLFRELTGQSLKSVLGISGDKFSNFTASYNFKGFHAYDNDAWKKPVYVNLNKADLIPAYSNASCAEYLRNRGISKSTADAMNMYYAEETRINTTLFKRRLIIPIYEDGTLLSVEGRRVFKEDDGPKVLYPKNATTATLFDIDNLDKSAPLYVVEGLCDLAVLREDPFFKNSTSIFGATLTRRQIHLLKQFDKIIYIPDSDEPGLKVLDTIKTNDLKNVSSLRLPRVINGVDIKDVGDLPKAGVTVEQLRNHNWLNYIRDL